MGEIIGRVPITEVSEHEPGFGCSSEEAVMIEYKGLIACSCGLLRKNNEKKNGDHSLRYISKGP